MKGTRNAALVLLLLALGVLLIAACGGDDDNGGGSSAATATREQSGSNPTATANASNPTATSGGANPTDNPGGADVTVSDACALMTQDEVQAALGGAVQAPVVTYTGSANVGLTSAKATVSTCSFVSETSINSVNVNYWSSPGNASAIKTMVEGACTGKEMIDGLGDVACWYDSQHVEIQLATGATFLDIFATTEGDSTNALLDLSGKAVGRLT